MFTDIQRAKPRIFFLFLFEFVCELVFLFLHMLTHIHILHILLFSFIYLLHSTLFINFRPKGEEKHSWNLKARAKCLYIQKRKMSKSFLFFFLPKWTMASRPGEPVIARAVRMVHLTASCTMGAVCFLLMFYTHHIFAHTLTNISPVLGLYYLFMFM